MKRFFTCNLEKFELRLAALEKAQQAPKLCPTCMGTGPTGAVRISFTGAHRWAKCPDEFHAGVFINAIERCGCISRYPKGTCPQTSVSHSEGFDPRPFPPPKRMTRIEWLCEEQKTKKKLEIKCPFCCGKWSACGFEDSVMEGFGRHVMDYHRPSSVSNAAAMYYGKVLLEALGDAAVLQTALDYEVEKAATMAGEWLRFKRKGAQ